MLLSVQLKKQTNFHHQQLEKQIVGLIKAIRTTTDYSKLLMLFYTYFGGLELSVDNTLEIACVPDYLKRRKTAYLSYDLYMMKAIAQPFASGPELPLIKSNLQAIGAMYVMEGSTLGGMYISRMIRGQLEVAHEKSFTFFDGCQKETQQMWRAFKMAIDGMLLDPGEEATVIYAANETFTQFSNWIKS